MSLYEVIFGKSMRVPFDTCILNDMDLSPDIDSYVHKMVDRIETTRSVAQSAHDNANETSKFFYDRNAAYPIYTVGQKVLLHDETTKVTENRKTKRRYLGPYFIEKVLPNYNFELRHCQTNILKKTPVHSNRLRPFYDDRSSFYKVAPKQQINDSESAAVPTVPQSQSQGNDGWYEVVKLSKKRNIGGKPHYLVHWRDKNAKKTWEPEQNITRSAIEAFEKSRKPKRTPKRR